MNVDIMHPIDSIIYIYYRIFKYKNASNFRKIIDRNKRNAIDIVWGMIFKKRFPWEEPRTLNEKITWLSGMSDTTRWTELADKFEVRKYVERHGFGDILTKCYGVWDKTEDINFDKLPRAFVLKCTHDCGSTLIVKDKKELNIEYTLEFLNRHLNERIGYKTCEPHYNHIKPRVMAEEIIPFDDNVSFSIIDYKFWVLGGKCKYCMLVYDRQSEENGGNYVLDLYEVNPWKQCEGLISAYDNRYKRTMEEPENLLEMVHIAESLGEEFPQVRVDLYNVKGKIYFGEMTFTSQGGRMSYYTEEFQNKLGTMVDLSPYGL